MDYPMFSHLHTEEVIREFVSELISEEIDNLSTTYEQREIAEWKSIREAVVNGTFIDYRAKDDINTLLKSAMDEYIIQNVGNELPEFMPDLLIYGEAYELLCR